MRTETPTRTRYLPDRQAAGLLAAVAADPFAGLVVGVEAPGGYGKTAVLDELSRLYRHAGVEVVGAEEALADPEACRDDAPDARTPLGDPDARTPLPEVARRAAIVVDDAHRLDEARILRLCRLAGTPGVRLAVGYRPWPRPPALDRLTAVLRRHRPVLPLAPLSAEQVGELLAQRLATPPAVERAAAADRRTLAAAVRTLTGGVPRYVLCLVSAAAAGAPSAAGTPGAGDPAAAWPADLPEAALDRVRQEIGRLDAECQRYLIAAEVGAAHLDLLGPLLDRDPVELGPVAEAVRATGLLGEDGSLLPFAARALGVLVPRTQRIAVRQRLAELRLARGGSVLGLARSLVSTGIAGPRAAQVFAAAAEEGLPDRPGLAASMFAAAAAAGRPTRTLAARWSLAAALAGDLGGALRITDEVIAGPPGPEQVECVLVAASALAHRGQLARAADLYRWADARPAGPAPVAPALAVGRAFGSIVRMAIGEPGGRDAEQSDTPPTLLAGAARLTARGVRESVGGSPAAALSTLVRAADLLEPVGPGALLPDTPAALAALVGLHSGEFNTARAVLDRAIAARLGGAPLAARHRLLQAWVLLARGETTAARVALPREVGALAPRDRLFAVALDVGLARRDSDLPALRRAWSAAGEAALHQPVDLFTLLPLGELVVAAARLGAGDAVAAQLADARALLARLGDPPLWALPLHWNCLHAAIIGNRTEAAAEHAAVLAAAAGHSRYAAVIAAAAQSWVAVLGGEVDPDRVAAAAQGLSDAGLCWDASRLAGQAAIRTSDRRAMVALLERARLLRGRSPSGQAGDDGSTGQAGTDRVGLSEREREVVDLVLAGMTYRQISGRLYISPKTVEHHVARIRQRLGCRSRHELLATLRAMFPPG